MDHMTFGIVLVLGIILLAEASNGWSDAPTGTSAAVATGVLSSKQALWITAIGNLVGLILALIFGAAVAKTIGTGIVRPEAITVGSIAIAMLTTVIWAALAVWLGFPVSKTHSLLAALAGIGYAQGGFEALLPASGDWHDSGWVEAARGVFFAIAIGAPMSWFLTQIVMRTGLHESIPEKWWRRMQIGTVCGVSSGHGFNDGLKYVGVFTLVLYKSGVISEFVVLPEVIILCAVTMGAGTLIGGWRIHRRLEHMVNHHKKESFKPFMGVVTELVSAFAIWKSGSVGIPMSTNHAVVAAMAGARSASGKVHIGSVVRIMWGWIITYIFCFFVAEYGTLLFI